MMRRLFYIMVAYLAVAVSAAVTAQVGSDIPVVLNTAFQDNGVQFMSEKKYQLGVLDYAVPLLEKIELRSETNDFDFREQDFTIRVTPNNSASRKAHRHYHESVKFMAEMELNTEIMRSLYDRYSLIKDFIFANEQAEQAAIKNAVAKDKVKLLKRMVSLSSFDIVDLIEAEDQVNNLQRTTQELENQRAYLRQQLRELTSLGDPRIVLQDLISVESIKTLLSLDALNSERSHPEVEVLSAKHYNVMMEHEWEVSKKKFSIGFLQASYGHNADRSFGNNFSLGFGFDFPTKGSSGLELNELKVNILDAQSQYLDAVEEIRRAEQASREKLRSLIVMYELLSRQIEEGNASHALTEYSKQAVASPLALLKLKELTVDNQILLLDIHADIIQAYLEHIYSTGAMGSVPYQNFFDADLTLLH